MIEEIMYGLQSKLPNRHIFIYAKPEFNSDQMREIRLGFENGIALCDILIYAKPKDFNYEQMKEIRLGFESRLIIDQILKYAKPLKEIPGTLSGISIINSTHNY